MSVREEACRILYEVLEQEGKSHILLRRLSVRHPDYTARDNAFVRQLVNGTIERAPLLDYLINSVSSMPVRKMKPYVRTVLRMGAYQLLFMSSVPASAACNESVRLIKKRKMGALAGFVNGVLRKLAAELASEETLTESKSAAKPDSAAALLQTLPREAALCMPSEPYEIICETLGSHVTEGVCRRFLEPMPLTVRCNLSRCTRESVLTLLEEDGIRSVAVDLLPEALLLPAGGNIERTRAFRRGLIRVQDISSILVGRAAGIEPGMQVLDMCAAPGGKCLHAADLLKGTGHVYAHDISEAKLHLINENIAVSGFANISAAIQDAAVYNPSYEARFDVVLADLPCSGLGVIGRKPEIRYRITREQVDALAALQRSILQVAARYVKPGGRLIYSTCTMTRQENEENYRRLLAEGGFRADDLASHLPEVLRPHVREGALQLYPGILPVACDGFFVSAAVREKEQEEMTI